jgi:hypothetical protein
MQKGIVDGFKDAGRTLRWAAHKHAAHEMGPGEKNMVK